MLEGGANIVPLSSSTLSHHVASLHLKRGSNFDVPLTRDMLRPLRSLPRLTALQLTLCNDVAVDHFMQGLSVDEAAAAICAVLPTQLRSFGVIVGSKYCRLNEQTAALASSFWAALGGMTQLTELNIEQHGSSMHARPELDRMPHLRKLTMGPEGWCYENTDVAVLKQLNQLRELTLHEYFTPRIRLLCQPPHSLQLESLTLGSMEVDEETMRALLHLPTLTALTVHHIQPVAWVALQLPLLRRLSLQYVPFSIHHLPSLCVSLSRCTMLKDLTLCRVHFVAANHEPTNEEQQAGWAELFSSVPNLWRLCVEADMHPLLPTLPMHLPLLERLTLSGWGERHVDYFAAVAHPNVRLLELGSINKRPASDTQLRACMHNKERLPKLERCSRTSDVA
jgi:hypothetical protein